MTSSKKNKNELTKLNDKYRLVIINKQSYEEVFASRLTRLQFIVFTSISIVFLIVAVTILIAFTGLKEFIPGYPDSNQRLLIVRNAQRIDSLIIEMNRKDFYLANIRTILRGEIPDQVNQTDYSKTNDDFHSNQSQKITFERSEEDSIFRKQIETEEKFNLSVQQSKNAVTFENTFFFSPIKGMITNSFGSSQGHYGVDIAAAIGARVSAVMEGVVTFSGWTVETGYVIQVQHPNNLMTIYKHNERLLKQVGEVVKAGEAIACVGNSGELTSGPHLHFELWYNGTPLNPQEYIAF
jgi:murein DD-endopeptidase MepM/ murein hydrolase activator NlpD